MRLWVDECLSPTLVDVARRRYEATCNDYRGLLHAKDPVLDTVITAEECVLVTSRVPRSDGAGSLHSGLILLPQPTRVDQTLMLEAALDYIDLRCREAAMPPAAG